MDSGLFENRDESKIQKRNQVESEDDSEMEDGSNASSGDPLPETKKQEEVEPSRGDHWSPPDIEAAYPFKKHMIKHENGDFAPVYAFVDIAYADVARAVEPSLENVPVSYQFMCESSCLLFSCSVHPAGDEHQLALIQLLMITLLSVR